MARTPNTQTWWPYSFEWVPLSCLVIERFDGDEGFQRPASERFIERAVKEFDARRFEPLIVVAMDCDGETKYSVIDGQHRNGIAERYPVECAPCLVHREVLTYEERAMLFHELNLRRRQLNLRDAMRARYEGGDEDMLGLIELLSRHRFYLDGYKPRPQNGHRPLLAKGALDREYKADANALDTALGVMETWHDLTSSGVQANVIGGLCLIARQGQFQPDRMRSIFARVGPQALIRDARELAAKRQTGIANYRLVAEAMLARYNRGLRSGRVTLDG